MMNNNLVFKLMAVLKIVDLLGLEEETMLVYFPCHNTLTIKTLDFRYDVTIYMYCISCIKNE